MNEPGGGRSGHDFRYPLHVPGRLLKPPRFSLHGSGQIHDGEKHAAIVFLRPAQVFQQSLSLNSRIEKPFSVEEFIQKTPVVPRPAQVAKPVVVVRKEMRLNKLAPRKVVAGHKDMVQQGRARPWIAYDENGIGGFGHHSASILDPRVVLDLVVIC